jgi:hypothetical protein
MPVKQELLFFLDGECDIMIKFIPSDKLVNNIDKFMSTLNDDQIRNFLKIESEIYREVCSVKIIKLKNSYH